MLAGSRLQKYIVSLFNNKNICNYNNSNKRKLTVNTNINCEWKFVRERQSGRDSADEPWAIVFLHIYYLQVL